MSSYLPQKTSVVCTMQMSPTPGKLLADPKARSLSVIHSKEDAVMLTKVDLILMDDFACQNKWQGPITSAAFWGGLAAGLLMAAAAAFSILTLGVGAIIIGACVVAAAAYAYSAAQSNSTKCTKMLTAWQECHPSVNFDQNPALTQRSLLTCSVGGLLKPYISEAAAQGAANEIAWANRGEVSLSGVISFIFGASVGYTLGTSGLIAAGAEVLIGITGAYLVFAPISYGEKKGIRAYNDTDGGDTEYDRMIAAKEDMEDGGFEYDSADDDYNPVNFAKGIKEIKNSSQSIAEQNRNLRLIDKMMNVKGTRAERNAAMEAIAKEMSKTESGAKAVEAMRRRSGLIYPREKTVRKGNTAVEPYKTESTKARNRAVWGTKGKGFTNGTAYNASALALPLLITPLDEYTIIAASNYAEEDAKEGNSIVSETH